ncbi:type II toxin-antitoxin system HicB family antitoxin [Geminocystis herdmanii]|uniref:type II toxin-antitoxin system HicB family antitoxin n=1 Tax=Geminocystis herdmanii TaxID=669359 RepID=UPI0003711E42|nr:type II toxin-antitoxin system HicB family antitoxin [Geminocystis herdmanii]
MENYNYTMLIQWSEEDQCFVVSLPEWGEFCHTHGDTYEEGVKNGKELLDFLIESAIKAQEDLQKIKMFSLV